MKRHPALADLSRDHHHALVLAQRAQKAGEEPADAQASFAADLVVTFRRDLEAHFQKEERSLLPPLEKAGLAEPVARTLAEHRVLRELIDRLDGGELACLSAFGALLGAHVRFEERELFPLAETELPPESLARLEQELRS